MKKNLLFGLAGLILAFGAQTQAEAMQWNTARPGATFRSFPLRVAAPEACRDACFNNRYCRSWTYVKPYTRYDSRPRCLLKDAVTPPQRDRCCVSGVIPPPRYRY